LIYLTDAKSLLSRIAKISVIFGSKITHGPLSVPVKVILNSDTENTSPDKLLEKKNEINNISQVPLKLISIKSSSD
jgi:hypothetical protein